MSVSIDSTGGGTSLTPHPGTLTWQRAGDARLLFAAGYALLLQVSHPTVGAGVSEHSRFREDPWGRLLRTLDYTCTMVYGGPLAAQAMGRRIRAYHGRIRGSRPDGRSYQALEPGAYAWVHATLAEAIVRASEQFGRPLQRSQREQFWVEWRALGGLLGIRDDDLPADWSAFGEYFEETVNSTLAHTDAVDEVLDTLRHPISPTPLLDGPPWAVVRFPLSRLLMLTTIGLLPTALRRRFALSWTRTNEIELRVVALALRTATPIMPPWLRTTGPGYLRARREAIERGDVASPQSLAR